MLRFKVLGKFMATALSVTIFCVALPPANAALAGSKCPKVNAITLDGAKVLFCTKSGSKFVWKIASSAQLKSNKKKVESLREAANKTAKENANKSETSEIALDNSKMAELQKRIDKLGANVKIALEESATAVAGNQTAATTLEKRLVQLNMYKSSYEALINSPMSQAEREGLAAELAMIQNRYDQALLEVNVAKEDEKLAVAKAIVAQQELVRALADAELAGFHLKYDFN